MVTWLMYVVWLNTLHKSYQKLFWSKVIQGHKVKFKGQIPKNIQKLITPT